MSKFNIQDLVFLHFTILGIFVTLFTISTALTKDVRQDLIKDYYLKSFHVLSYIILIIVSFFISIASYIYNWLTIAFLLCVFLFLYSICFVFAFISTLNRKWLYNRMIEKFKEEIKKDTRAVDCNTNHTKSGYKSLADFFKNLSYVETSSNDFTEEIEAIKQFVKDTPVDKRTEIWDNLYSSPFQMIENTKLLYELFLAFYDLKSNEYNNLDNVLFYQNVSHLLCCKLLLASKGFDNKINSLALYLKEFLDFRNIDTFKQSTDYAWLENYNKLIGSTADKIFILSKIILELNFDSGHKKQYFDNYIESLSKVLEHYFESDYDENSYQLKIWNNQNSNILEKLLELFYLILTRIEQEKLPKSFFETALNVYTRKEFKEKFYSSPNRQINLLEGFNPLNPGAQFVSFCNYNKFRILFLFYEYAKEPNKSVNLSIFKKEDFYESSEQSLETSINNLNPKFIKRYFDFEEEILSDFEKKFNEEFVKEKENLLKQEKDYLSKTPINQKYVQKFKNDYIEVWKKYNANFSKFLEVKTINSHEKSLVCGINHLVEKILFIAPYNDNTHIIRDMGKQYGERLNEAKYKNILEKIDKKFDTQNDAEVIVKNLAMELGDYVRIESEREYFLFTDRRNEVVNIPNFKWVRDGLVYAKIEINNSEISICYSSYPVTLLFEKDEFILQQYLNNETKEPVNITIDEIDKSEIDGILKNNKKLTQESIKEYIGIRIFEYFDINRKNSSKLTRLLF